MIGAIVVAGFYQQVQTTRKRKEEPNNNDQAPQMQGMQNAMKIMPVVFGFISWQFVTGLGLYFATSNIFRVGQQAIILNMRHGDDSSDGDKDGGKAEAPPAQPEKGPSKNASKKRNRRRKK